MREKQGNKGLSMGTIGSKGPVVITGAFSYTGKYATRILLELDYTVRTLTSRRVAAGEFAGRVETFPLQFESSEDLAKSLEGASALINTYWVRFPRKGVTFETAVRNTRNLIRAAQSAGVKRIVHVSIANPSLDSQLGYYKGKAELEEAVKGSGLSFAIVRPTVIFGQEDILINNIAWVLRRLPMFGVPGDGQYGVRPIYVEDMARLLIACLESDTNQVVNAVGPESYSFEELVRMIAREIGTRRKIFRVPLTAAYLSTWILGWAVGDVVLTWEEYKGLMANLLVPEGPATGKTRLSEWLKLHRDSVGKSYASEIARHYARPSRLG